MRNEDVVSRALAAYFRAGGNQQPASSSGERGHADKRYVVLEDAAGTLAVYRVRPDGVLKGLRRWPRELAAPSEGAEPIAAAASDEPTPRS